MTRMAALYADLTEEPIHKLPIWLRVLIVSGGSLAIWGLALGAPFVLSSCH